MLLYITCCSLATYALSAHNQFCRWTNDSERVLLKSSYDKYPKGNAWCFSQQNEVLDCEILPCFGNYTHKSKKKSSIGLVLKVNLFYADVLITTNNAKSLLRVKRWCFF